jgi:hypothetical protein
MSMMKDNYLWDRSGEPDAEVQELEELLGALRYQPKPLEIPDHIQPGHRRTFFPVMAIAAAIALCAVLLGLWFSFNRRQSPALMANNNSHLDKPVKVTAPPADPGNETARAPVQPASEQPRPAKRGDGIARRQTHISRPLYREPELTAEEQAEKEQVLVALRLVSFKLNLAQRKTQGAPQLNPIRNQHRIG